MRNMVDGDSGRQAEERFADDQAGLIIGGMRELKSARHVADRIGFAVAGPQTRIDGDALGGKGDAGLHEAEPLDVGPSPGCDQEVAADDLVWSAASGERNRNAVRCLADFSDLRMAMD